MSPDVKAKFEAYPEDVRSILFAYFSIAEENQLGAVEETLKWG